MTWAAVNTRPPAAIQPVPRLVLPAWVWERTTT